MRGAVVAALWMLAASVAGAVPVTGVVLQTAGLPAVGATVELRREELPFTFIAAAAPLTDESGRFAADLAAGVYEAFITGSEVDTRHLFEVPDGVPQELRLGVDWPWARRPVARARVRVVNSDGSPAADTAVEARGLGLAEPIDWRMRYPDPYSVYAWPAPSFGARRRTDREGRVSFELPAGMLGVVFSSYPVQSPLGGMVKPGAELPEQVLRLPGKARRRDSLVGPTMPPVRLRVVGPDGRELRDQWVQVRGLSDAREPSARFARLDEHGVVVVPDAVRRAAYVAVKAAGWCATERIAMPGSGVATVRLKTPAGALAGTVHDEQGRPLAGAFVLVCRPRWHRQGEVDDCLPELARGFAQRSLRAPAMPWPDEPPTVEPLPDTRLAGWLTATVHYAVTDAQGRYRVGDLDGGMWHAVFYRRGYVPQEVRSPAPTRAVDVVLSARADVLSGRVTGPDGQPWRNRAVICSVDPRDPRPVLAWPAACGYCVLTDDQGGYRVAEPDMLTGPAIVTLKTAGRSAGAVEVALATALPTRVDATLPALVTVSGRVLGPDGEPVAQAWVTQVRSGRELTAWTGADGRFSLDVLDDRPLTLAVYANGCASRETTADPRRKAEITIRLRPGTVLAGQVRTYRDIPSIYLQLQPLVPPLDTPAITSRLSALTNGWFAAYGLPPGPVRVVATAAGCQPAELTVELPLSKPVAIDLGPARSGTVVVRVVDSAGRPKPDLYLHLFGEGVPPGETATTDKTGTARFVEVPSGEYLVSVTPPGMPEHTAAVVVEAGRTANAALTLDRRVVDTRLTGMPPDWWAEAYVMAPYQPPFGGFGLRPPVLRRFVPEALEAMVAPLTIGVDRCQSLSPMGPRRAWLLMRHLGDDPEDTDYALWEMRAGTVGEQGAELRWTVPAARAGLTVALTGVPPANEGAEPRGVMLNSARTGEPVAFGRVSGDRVIDWPCLPPGEYVLTADCPGRAGPRLPVRLLAGDQRRIAVALHEGVTVIGTVSGALHLDHVILENDQVYACAAVRADRSFTLDGVPPGEYEVWSGCSAQYDRRRVTVGQQNLVLRLSVGAAP